jgi:hypothetical protein
MSSSDLKADFAYAFKLMKRRFPVDFVKPDFKQITPSEWMDLFVEVQSMKDILRLPPVMLYEPAKNMIYAVRHSDRHMDSLGGPPTYTFSHEIAHVIQIRLNKDFSEDNLDKLIKSKGKQREKGVTLLSFCEGMAEFMAIETCSLSKDSKLEAFTRSMDADYKRLFEQFRNDNQPLCVKMYSEKHGIDPSDWPKLLAKFHLRNDGCTLQTHPYVFGYNFASNHKDLDTLELIANPPRNYKELSIPNAYILEH